MLGLVVTDGLRLVRPGGAAGLLRKGGRRHQARTTSPQAAAASVQPKADCLRACEAQDDDEAAGAVHSHELELGHERRTHSVSRRQALASAAAAATCASWLDSLSPGTANAAVDVPLRLEDVTPAVIPAGPLPPSELATVQLFEASTYSVANIIDVTLRPGIRSVGEVEIPEGNGSGIVWDSEGHVVTNYHVVGSVLSRNIRPGDTVAQVTLLRSDGYQQTFGATLVGADRSKDLAVLQVRAPSEVLRPIPLGTSSELKVGQRCFAIGNPFGFDHTLTTGVISGLERDIYSQANVVISGGIQTDASINPGNSGGPLLDSKGRLIGINTAIFTRSGTSAGVGFAIPIDAIVRVVPQLIQYGKVVRAGLNLVFASSQVAKQLQVKTGALILSIPPNSAAAKAGLQSTRRGLTGIVPGDVIIDADGMQVKTPLDLSKVLDKHRVGDKVTLTVLRTDNGSQREVKVPVVLEESSM